MKIIVLTATITLSSLGGALATGLGIGAGQDNTGKIFFVYARGTDSQAALDKAREMCIAKYQNCTPLVQLDKGCVSLVAGLAPAGVQIFRGATQQEALQSCAIGGANCMPPVEAMTECVK